MSDAGVVGRHTALILCWLLVLAALGPAAPIGAATAAGNTCTGLNSTADPIDESGCYVLNTTNTSVTSTNGLEIRADDVILHGDGNTLAAGTGAAQRGVLVRTEARTENVTVSNLTVRGFNRSGVAAFDAIDVTVENVTANEQVGLQSYGIELSDTTNARIDGVVANRNGGDGVRISGGSGVTVTDATLLDNNQSGFDAENAASDITVRDTNASLSNRSTAEGFELGNSLTNVTLENVTAVKNNDKGLVVFGNSSEVTLVESRVTHNRGDGVRLQNATQVEIERSRISRNSNNGIEVFDQARNVSVSESELVDNTDAGLRALDSQHITIEHTNASLHGRNRSLSPDERFRDGIGLSNVSEAVIKNITAVGNSDTGVNLYDGTSDVAVDRSRLHSNGNDGLRANGAENISVRDTNASLNDGTEFGDGITLRGVTRGSLSNLTATGNNGGGVVLFGGSESIRISGSQLTRNGVAGLSAGSSRNITVQDTNASYSTRNGSLGVLFGNVSDSTVANLTTVGNDGTGVTVVADSDGITLSGSLAERNRRDGVSVQNSTAVSIEDSRLSRNGNSGLNVTSGSSSVSVRDSRLSQNAASGVAVRSNTTDVTVSTSTLRNNSAGVSADTTRNVTVLRSRVLGNGVGVGISRSRNVSLVDSNVSFNTRAESSGGIVLDGVTEASIGNLTALQNGGAGVTLSGGSERIIFERSTLRANEIDGVRADGSADGVRDPVRDVVVRNTTTSSHTRFGVLAVAGENVSVLDTRARNNGVGVVVTESSDATVANTTARNNTGSGILLANATGVTVRDSVASANSEGVELTDSVFEGTPGATTNSTITNVTATDNGVAFTAGGGTEPARNNTIRRLDVGTAVLSSVDARLFGISELAELPATPENWTQTGVQFDASARPAAANESGFVDLTVDISGAVDGTDPSSLDLWRYDSDEGWVRTDAEVDAEGGTISQRFDGSCCSPVALLREETGEDDGGDGGGGGGGGVTQPSDPTRSDEPDGDSESDGELPLNLSAASTEFGDVRTNGSEDATLTLANDGDRTVTVERVETTESAFTPTRERFTLDPGESETVLVRFEPDDPGTYNGSVQFETASGTLSASLRGAALADTGADVNVSTTLGPDRRVVEATVANPVPGDPVGIPLPGDRLQRPGIDAAFENLTLTPNVSEDFELRVITSPAPLSTTPAFGPRETNGTVPLTFANITKTVPNRELQTVTVRARISKARLAELGARPETVVLFRYEGDRWVPKPTSVVAETDDTVVVAATAEGLSEWTAAARRPQFNITDALIDVETAVVGDTVTIQTFIENTGGADGLYEAELLINETVVDQRRTSIPPGGTAQLNFPRAFDAPRTYEVRVNNFTVGEVTVRQGESATEESTATPEGEPGGPSVIAAGVAVAVLVGVVLLARAVRRRS